MVILHKEAGAFIHWVEDNEEKLNPNDFDILNRAKNILCCTSAFEWYWMWPNIRLLITASLTDPDIKIEG